MKIRIRKKSEYKMMPWKNRQGVTAEIAIFPQDCQFPEEPFVWRLSTATVSASNTFSKFDGYERLLTVTQGKGFLLNQKELLPDQSIHFSGGVEVHCQLLEGGCKDLGLIYDPKKIDAEMEIQLLKEGSFRLNLQGERHFLFCSEGSFRIENVDIPSGDCVEIEKLEEIEVKVSSSAKLVVISLYEKASH